MWIMLWIMELNPVGGWSQVVSPGAQYWGQLCLISLSMIWTKGLSTRSVSLQMTQRWAEVFTESQNGHCGKGHLGII